MIHPVFIAISKCVLFPTFVDLVQFEFIIKVRNGLVIELLKKLKGFCENFN